MKGSDMKTGPKIIMSFENTVGAFSVSMEPGEDLRTLIVKLNKYAKLAQDLDSEEEELHTVVHAPMEDYL
jgi:hypothetical protein